MTTDTLISRLRATILKLRVEIYRRTKHEILNKLESELAAHEAATPAADVEAFRREVQDKLGVVFNGCNSSPLTRAIHRKQCEDFLVELFAKSHRASAEAAPVERPEGVSLIAAERRRQIDVEGWTPKHDDSHKDGILAAAAACLAAEGTDGEFTWPAYELSWIKSLRDRHVRDRQRQLVIAGALIAAEIDRLQRLPAIPPSTERTS